MFFNVFYLHINVFNIYGSARFKFRRSVHTSSS